MGANEFCQSRIPFVAAGGERGQHIGQGGRTAGVLNPVEIELFWKLALPIRLTELI